VRRPNAAPPRPSTRSTRTGIAAVMAFALLAGIMPTAGLQPVRAAATDLFISEYVEGSSNSKAIEIYNGTGGAVDASAYTLSFYFNGSPTAAFNLPLSGTIATGDVLVAVQAAADPALLALADITSSAGWFNGDDAVALRKGDTLIDVIGQIGFDPGSEWGTGLTSTADNTLRRKTGILAGDPDGTNVFDPAVEWDGFATNTFDGIGAHTATVPDDLPVAITCGGALTAVEGLAPATRSVTATDPDDTVVDIAISSVTPANAEITLTGLTAATEDGGTASATLNVGTSTPGTYTVGLIATNDDVASPQTATCSISVSVLDVRHIGEIQGSVDDSLANPTLSRSPYAPATGNGLGQTVATRGVIVQRTLAMTSAGARNHGFFLQEPADATDGDPTTSDGIFVFMNTFSSLIGGYVPEVGDEVVITGRVSEFFFLTQLSSASLVTVVRSDVDVAAEVPAFEIDPPADQVEANRYWERREGMQAQVPVGSLVQGGRSVFPSTADAEIYFYRDDYEPLAERTDPYARRIFRDPHPLDDIPVPLWDNGNGFRFLIGALGVKATADDETLLLTPADTNDILTNAPSGGVYYGFSKYQVQVAQQPTFTKGADPSLNGAPQAADPEVAWTSATYNVENLYDFRDDPFDGCDFVGNGGCPGVSPPFDYVPDSAAAYDAQLTALATQIIEDLKAPDLIMTQEGEDQDICTVVAGAFTCGVTDDRDDKPDTLQELALRISALGGPTYDAAYDRDGADDRGIVSGFLYRTDRVELLPVLADDPVLNADTGVEYDAEALAQNDDVQNPKALNADLPDDLQGGSTLDGSNVYTRAPQVGHFRVWRDGVGTSVFLDVWAVSNHFSSTPDGRVFQRIEQAAYLAAIVDAIEADDPDAYVVVGGDFNVFPRPDDPFAPGQPIGSSGLVGPSDQLGPLYDQGLLSLWESLVEEIPAAAYSYVFQGQAQTLDTQFISDDLAAEFEAYRVAHINADFAADYPGDGARGASDHDPSQARYSLEVTIERLDALVLYLAADGQILGNNTVKNLRAHLTRAAESLDQGRLAASRSQLIAFGDQLEDYTPRFIDAALAAEIQEELAVLLGG
jgi:predicted extracellular nuclease